MRVKLILGLLALTVLALPGVASARVHVDPNSPSGQEYALPLDHARGDATGGHGDVAGVAGGGGGGGQSGGGQSGGSGSSGGGSPPAFGVGISGRAGDSGGSQKQKSVGGGTPRTSDGAGSGGGTVPTAVGTRTAASSGSGGLGSTLLFSGLGVGTLVLGAAAGVLLRRRLGRSAF